MAMLQKTIFLLMLTLIGVSDLCWAQKILFADSEVILNNLPEYSNIQKQIDLYAQEIQKQTQKLNTEITALKEGLKKDQIILSEKIRQEREEVIAKKILDLQKYQNTMLGENGIFFKQRRVLLKPLQNKIYEVIKEIAQEKGADMVIDKASQQLAIMYANASKDITQEAIEKLKLDI